MNRTPCIVTPLRIAAACWLLAFASPALAAPDSFETTIAPLLAAKCGSCHGPVDAESGFRIDDRDHAFAGGDSGAVGIVAGDPAASELFARIVSDDEELRMPADGEPLSAAEQAAVKAWILAGAAWPDELKTLPASLLPRDVAKTAKGADHWAFQPVKQPKVPQRPADRRVTGPIDAFLDRRLAEQGLSFNPEADPRTLIRRVSFDLIGLPPTPEEVAAFEQACRQAGEIDGPYRELVDRLLASPRYGERWARHWLDVVRFAESDGFEMNRARTNAWPYRDWVIKSLNDDLPYDQFLRAQLIGDALAADAATGFIVGGPVDRVKSPDPVLTANQRADELHDMASTTGAAFLGLTVGCARCHDHKFDPISQHDYYALAGIFKSTRTMESLKRLATWHEHVIASPDARQAFEKHQQLVAAAEREIETFLAQTRRQLAASSAGGDGGAAIKSADLAKISEQKFPAAAQTRLAALRQNLKQLQADAPTLNSAMGVAEGEPEESRIHLRGSHLMLGSVVPRGVPRVLQFAGPLEIPPQVSGRRQLADWVVDSRHPLTARVLVNRVWRWHFGRGLVRTTDNFGTTGEPPTNQPLLDWLAVQLIESGWSLKDLHRLILSSRTWQQSSDPATSPTGPGGLQVDPDNRLWWRADVRRLEAESIRDAMLATSGLLDRTMGGSLLEVANRAFIFNHLSKDETRYDSSRRSVYLPVIRNHIHDALWLFDCTDGAVCVGDRTTSTVASQALYLLNSEFVIETAGAIAEAMVADAPEDFTMRLHLLFRRVFGRLPTAAETRAVRRAVDDLRRDFERQGVEEPDRGPSVWTVVCQSLLMSDDFLMLR